MSRDVRGGVISARFGHTMSGIPVRMVVSPQDAFEEPGAVEEPRSMLRALVVDDHPSFRRCARVLLSAEGFEVVGEAEDGASALELAAELAPDLVLLDIQLPDLNGFEVAARLLEHDRELPIVLVSSRDRSEYGSRIELCGARGFVCKDELSGAELARLIG